MKKMMKKNINKSPEISKKLTRDYTEGLMKKTNKPDKEFESIMEHLRGSQKKKKGKRMTTESSSDLSDSTYNQFSKGGKKKGKSKDEDWNLGIKVVNPNDRDYNFARQPFSDDEIKEAYKVFDRNKNGYVGAAEIRFVLDNMDEDVTDEEIDEMVRMLDYNGDGQVNFKEFYRMATGLLLPPVGTDLPDPFEDEVADNEMGNELDLLVRNAEKEIGKIKDVTKKQTSSGMTSYDDSSSSEEDSIKAKKKRFMKMING
jgi:hypothetical protein